MTAEQINKTEKMNGARIFLECLKMEGVDKIFGYPGKGPVSVIFILLAFAFYNLCFMYCGLANSAQ